MQKYNLFQPNENHVRNTRLEQKYSCVIGMGAGARCSKVGKVVQSQITRNQFHEKFREIDFT